MDDDCNIHQLTLKPPEEFKFPFPPYLIQKKFMSNLYMALEEKKLGIFESPTGTGKSLSIICGALCWLKDHERREKQVLEDKIESLKKEIVLVGNLDDWVKSQSRALELEHEQKILEQKLNKMKQHENKLEEIKKRTHSKKPSANQDLKKKEVLDDVKIEFSDIDEDLDILLEETEDLIKSDSEDEEEIEEHRVKIIVCSRTHSQLSQFVHEIKRSPYQEMCLVPLASRQNYCINPAVRKLKSITLINERCTDMQRKSKGKATITSNGGKTVKKSCTSKTCPYLSAQHAMTQLTEETLSSINDVESLVSHGERLSACPYYATRNAIPDAQIVVVPYNTLLHKRTRQACGLQVKGNVVIIDEAHNLIETIAQVHNALVTGHQLTHLRSQILQYRDKYHKKFSATNLLNIEQLIFVLGNLIRVIGGKPGSHPSENTKIVEAKLHSLSEFVLLAEIDNINIYNLIAFCNKSKLAHKLHGFTERYQPVVNINNAKNTQQQTGIKAFLKEIINRNAKSTREELENESQEIISNTPVLPVLAFLEALTNRTDDGRVVCTKKLTVGQSSLKFLLLNPASHFSEIVQQARSVIVAGGTMQPISEFREQLFLSAGAPLSRVLEYSCDHVIPPDHILPIALSQGPTNLQLDFSYQNRSSKVMLNEIGRVLSCVCSVVPAGIVCFFPSYDYEQMVYQFLEGSGDIAKLSIKKKIFREPKHSGQVDQVLSNYAAAVNEVKTNPKNKMSGALLFSVVGGKLSEGLNFSDDLGRCVIVVGMPYPNIKCPELQEKMSYLNSCVGNNAGKNHYENLCMKAVNQCIGRAVRHKEDYATVLLLDQRYARTTTQKLLPQWIKTSLQTHQKIGPALAQIARFFAAKRAIE
uniref:Helicase ATP-binding domain-containing protein n=1 Tax=Clastoptera arizonana TaxID=38151 RepID=A0A1B6DBS7_9HEMI